MLKQNIKSWNAKQRRQCQRMVKKTTIGLIGQKASLHAHFFSTFLCSCFAQLQCETFRNFLVIRFMEEILYMFLFTFFSPLLILNSFFHCCYKISCFPQENMSPLFFLSCSSSLSVWDSLACSATFSFSISKFVDMTILITLSLIL